MAFRNPYSYLALVRTSDWYKNSSWSDGGSQFSVMISETVLSGFKPVRQFLGLV